MNLPHYQVGDPVTLAPDRTANRIEATRPDGTMLRMEWDNRIPAFRPDQPGRWSWQLFIRDSGSTYTHQGQFEAIPGRDRTLRNPLAVLFRRNR